MKNKEKHARQSHWVYFIIAILVCLSFGYSPSASAENPSGFQKEHRDNMAGGCGALALNPGVSLNGFVNDQYQWYDSACHLRLAVVGAPVAVFLHKAARLAQDDMISVQRRAQRTARITGRRLDPHLLEGRLAHDPAQGHPDAARGGGDGP